MMFAPQCKQIYCKYSDINDIPVLIEYELGSYSLLEQSPDAVDHTIREYLVY